MLLRATILVTNRWNRSHLSWIFSTFLTFTLHTFVLIQLMCRSPTEMTAIPKSTLGKGKITQVFQWQRSYHQLKSLWKTKTWSSNFEGAVEYKIKKGSMANKKACLLKFSLTRSLVMEPKGRRLHLTSPKSLKFSRQVCPQIPLEAQRLGPHA